jgi:hypothetical protein
MEIQKLINCNTPNPLSPTSVDPSRCGKLAPDKFTFLKSNQIITKYVQMGNVQYNPMSQINCQGDVDNAYNACEREKAAYAVEEERRREEAEKALLQAKKSNEEYQRALQRNKAQVDKQVMST